MIKVTFQTLIQSFFIRFSSINTFYSQPSGSIVLGGIKAAMFGALLHILYTQRLLEVGD